VRVVNGGGVYDPKALIDRIRWSNTAT